MQVKAINLDFLEAKKQGNYSCPEKFQGNFSCPDTTRVTIVALGQL